MTLHHHSRGFSLIEVLVGLAVGLTVLLVIAQTFQVAEGYKRTTTSGSDSQTNGLLALRTLEAEVRTSGYGITNANLSLCTQINQYYNGAGVTNRPFMAVSLINNEANNSDSIRVLYSGSAGGASPAQIRTAMPTPSNVTKVNTLAGLQECDFVLYASKSGDKQCALLQVTGFQTNNVQFQTGSGQSNYNPPGGFNGALFDPAGYTTQDVIINVGQYIDRKFSVYKTSSKDEYFLRQTKMNAGASGCGTADTTPADLDRISNIVNIQAQYGVAPAGSQTINCWTSARTSDTGCGIPAGRNWSAPQAADAKRIKAIRMAIVTRSPLDEREKDGSGNCTTTQVAPSLGWNDDGANIDLSNIPNWKCYRYKVYQTIVPLINVLWANI